MQEKLQQLKERLIEVNDIESAMSLLNWDQSTYMPPGGAPARARQISTLTRIATEKFADPEIGQLLDDLEKETQNLDYDSDDASLVRETRRQYERALKVPPAFIAELYAHWSEGYQLWAVARSKNDFDAVKTYLKKNLDYSRRLADYFPGYEHIADPLIAESDFGMKAESIRQVFAELREQLVPIVQQVTSQTPADASCLYASYPLDKQLAFAKDIVTAFGYDYNRGRQDLTHHPFATKFSIGDVRITTRGDDNHLGDGIFATLHESGHAMYEQGVKMDYEGTTLASGTSAGVHESQSRTWENIVGRGQAMWQHYYPILQQTFPDNLKNVPLETFYAAINRVERSLIRVAADELTYNLHIMIRFDLELEMLEGALSIDDLPEAWNARYESDLGVRPADYANGCMQDVHWYAGPIGGSFQGYCLGNIMSAQFYNAALKANPSIPDELAQGEFSTLYGWLKDNIYQHGKKFTADELLNRVVGESLQVQPLVDYLKTKYGALYDLS